LVAEGKGRSTETGGIELPAPTSAPLYFALGLALLFAGLVTHPLVSAVGLASAIGGAIAWWREVLPRAREVLVPFQGDAERARPIAARRDAVARLVAGRDRHRLRLPEEVRPYSAGLRAGAAGAVAMAVVACAYGVVAHGSPWLPINLLAGMALPSLDQAQAGELRAFHATAFALACVVHAGLSLLVGLVYAAILPMLPGRPLLWGGIVAPLAWTAVAWSTLGIVNPALEQHVSWPWFIASQIAFGLAAGFAIARIEPIRTLQSQPLMVRAGIEGAGGASEREEHE
jgi:hypothetical protein